MAEQENGSRDRRRRSFQGRRQSGRFVVEGGKLPLGTAVGGRRERREEGGDVGPVGYLFFEYTAADQGPSTLGARIQSRILFVPVATGDGTPEADVIRGEFLNLWSAC